MHKNLILFQFSGAKKNEDVARQKYIEICRQKHSGLKVETCGLFVRTEYPHLGASPDGTVTCDCCGIGCIEIKCPNTFCNQSLHNHSCYTSKENQLQLNTDHSYYYQVQTHLFVTRFSYSDLVLWTPNEIVIHRVTGDKPFQEAMIQKATTIFKDVLLLELLGCFYSRTKSARKNKENVPHNAVAT